MIAMDTIRELQQKCNSLTYGDLISIANFMTVWAQTNLVQIVLAEQRGDEQMRERLSKIDMKDLPKTYPG